MSDALKRIAERLRRAGASVPAPENKGTIESAMATGLSIALLLIEQEIEEQAGITRKPLQWIPVTERLPPVGVCTEYPDCNGCDVVLVHYEASVMEDTGGSRYQTCATAWFHGPYYDPTRITHWMRIPPAPDHGITPQAGEESGE